MKGASNIKIRPVDKENWADFETLFESKGGPAYCWCMAWRMTKEELKNNNTASRKKFINQRVMSNTPVGLLAYRGDEPIAWCSIAPRDTYQRLGGDEQIDKVWSIACFYVKKEFRDQGFVDFLIEGARNMQRRTVQNIWKHTLLIPTLPVTGSWVL
jgi:hypothetical protein